MIKSIFKSIFSKINPPIEEEVRKKHKNEFYLYLCQHPGFMAINLIDQIEDFEMNILSEDYFILKSGKSFGNLILHRETIDPSKNLNELLIKDLENFRERVKKINKLYLENGEINLDSYYDRVILNQCFRSPDIKYSSKFFKYLNKLNNESKA